MLRRILGGHSYGGALFVCGGGGCVELKEMAAKIREVLGVSDMAKLSERLM